MIKTVSLQMMLARLYSEDFSGARRGAVNMSSDSDLKQPLIRKYQVALALAQKDLLDAGVFIHQNGDLLITLRNST